MGLRRAAEDEGISPSASGKPFDSIQRMSSMPLQFVYTIKTQDLTRIALISHTE